MRLRGVLKYEQSLLLRHGIDRIHVGRLAVKVDRYDRARPGRDCGFDARRVDVEAGWYRLDRDDGCPAGGNRKPGSDEGMAGHDDLIAWADAGSAQREDQRFKPVTHANTVPGPAVVGKLILECLKLRAENVMGCRPHAGQGGVELCPCLGIDSRKVKKRDVHPFPAASANAA